MYIIDKRERERKERGGGRRMCVPFHWKQVSVTG